MITVVEFRAKQATAQGVGICNLCRDRYTHFVLCRARRQYCPQAKVHILQVCLYVTTHYIISLLPSRLEFDR